MSPTDQPEPAVHTPLPLRVTLFALGTVSLGLGVLGVILPLLPTTPFILLAAGCYARAWPAAHQWIRTNRFFGPIVNSGAEGRYLPVRAKAIALGLTVASFGGTLFCTALAWPWKALLLLLGAGVTTWLARLPTEPRAVPERVHRDTTSE